MSHYHCEVIMPPNADVESALAEVLKPFDESREDNSCAVTFWDWYVIGGRWAGNKEECRLEPEALEAFNQWMKDEGVMVQGLVCGKEELADEKTRRRVDAKWREMFPGNGEHCTLFMHSNPDREALTGDICPLSEVSDRVTAARVIIAAPNHDGSGLEAAEMFQKEFWNGVSHVDAKWDGNVLGAVSEFREKIGDYAEGYKERAAPRSDWLTVTVDYHS